MPAGGWRIERDGLGAVRVPSSALYGAHTQRAVQNFPISGRRLPRSFLRALGLIKAAAAVANRRLGLLDGRLAAAIASASADVAAGRHDAHFPLDVFQSGSATSTNMNANEVIARLASRRVGRRVHPPDHVNMSQSSNDVIPSSIHVGASLVLAEELLPALRHLARTIRAKAARLGGVVTTGRTHLMDAVPITLGQELGGWAAQVEQGIARLQGVRPRLSQLPLGGTAVGTGVNAPAAFGRRACAELSRRTGLRFALSPNRFAAQSSQDTAVELSGQLKTVAVNLAKICGDLRLMNSGPLAGFGEISLPILQEGSSIMPGKVNPVIPEAVLMVCAQVIGNDLTITLGAQAGHFQLNTMLPLIATRLLENLSLLAAASRVLADKAIRGFAVNRERVAGALSRNPILATALNPLIGYEQAARIARRAAATGRPVRDVAAEMTRLSRRQLARLLDPRRLTRGGLQGNRATRAGRVR
jgi:fumarate hydratase class II